MAVVTTQLGDITSFSADAIVNAANSSLLGGGGVDGAIHRAGGPSILAACQEIRADRGPLGTGGAVATPAGDLPARWVIHTVGPIWEQVTPDEGVRLLAACYLNSLDLCVTLGARTVAFPNISTGVYRFPKPLAAKTAVSTVASSAALASLDAVTFVCFDDQNLNLYEALLEGGAA